MDSSDTILEKIALLKPSNVLEIGCGCGSFTSKLSPYCGKITAIDLSTELIDRCHRENPKPNIDYVCMDARDIDYPDASFDLVCERVSLHHILEWERVLSEMARLSSGYIWIEEPLDDPRNEAKRNTMRAQRFYLEIQNEVGYSHYPYMDLSLLLGYFRGKGLEFETKVTKSDQPVDFDQYFSAFGNFADKSKRSAYWYDRLDRLRREFKDKSLCEEDVVFISARK
jgi:SAM-dependent methyltransferase